MKKEIEIPDGHEAKIEGNKVVFVLKESEDERIRREMIEYFHGCIRRNKKSGFRVEQIKGWIAYLEKQKENHWVPSDEQRHALGMVLKYSEHNDESTKVLESLLDDLTKIANPKVAKWKEKWKEQKVDIDKLRKDIYQSGYNDGYQHGKVDAQKEQMPAEWSEEGTMHLTNAILASEKEWGEDSATVAFLKSLRPQSKAKWSDDDEKMLERIIQRGSCIIPSGEDALLPAHIEWLKSLRNRMVWKPSEEQMKALEWAASPSNPLHAVLSTLCEDLKKL